MDILNNLDQIITNNIFLGIILALLAGIAASFSPCCLSTLPLIIGHVSTSKENIKVKKSLLHSLVFAFGTVITFTLIGIISVIIGDKIKFLSGNLWYIILSAVLIYSSLYLFGVFKSKTVCVVQKPRKGLLGAFFLGILGGLFSSPCATPALAVIIAYASNQGNILTGAILMAVYSIGHSLIIIIAGISVGSINKLTESSKYIKIGRILRYALGVITLILALYMLYIAI